MYAPQLERFQRRLAQQIWFRIVYYYKYAVDTACELPHHLRLLWDGAFSFDDIYKPDSSFDVLKYLTVALPTSDSDDIKISELSLDPYQIASPASNYSEELNILDDLSYAADSDAYFLPVALEPPTPTTMQPLCVSFLVFVLFGLFTTYKSFSNRQDSRRRTASAQDVVPQVPEKQRESDGVVTESSDTIAKLREQLANSEQARVDESRESELEVAMLVAKAADLEVANHSKGQAIISLNADISNAKAETETIRKSNEELTSKNETYKKVNYEYTEAQRRKNNQKSPNKGTPAAVAAPETASKDKAIIADKSAKISKLEREAVGLNEQIQAKIEGLQNKEIEFRANERTHKKEKDSLQKGIQTLRKESTTLITEKTEVVQENKLLKTKVAELNNDNKAKDASIAELKRTDPSKEILKQMYESSSKENVKLTQANTKLQAKVTAKDHEIAQARQAITKLQAERTEKNAELAQVSKQNGELQDKLIVLKVKSETQAHGTQTDDYVATEIEEAKSGLATKLGEQAAELDQLKQEKDQLETRLIEKDAELEEANRENFELEGQTVEKNKKLNDALEGNAELGMALIEERRLVGQWVQFYDSIRSTIEASEQATQSADEQDAFEGPVGDEDLEQVVEDATTKEALEAEIAYQAPIIRLPPTSIPYNPIVNRNPSVEPEPPAEPQEAEIHQRSAKNVFPKPQKNLHPKEIARRAADREYSYPAPLNIIVWTHETDMREPLKLVHHPKPYLNRSKEIYDAKSSVQSSSTASQQAESSSTVSGCDTSTIKVSGISVNGRSRTEELKQGLQASRWAS